MKGIEKINWAMFGAYLASEAFREEVGSADFVDDDLAKCVEEIEGVTSGKISKEEMRYLPVLMETLQCPDGGKAIDGMVQTAKAHRRMVEANKLGKRLQMALPHEIDQLKERMANL